MSDNASTGPESGRPRLLHAAATTYASRIGFAVLSFASVLITARALGAEGRGSIAFLTMVGFFTAQLATLGIFQADANFAAREPHLTRSLAGTSLVLSAIFGTVAAGIVALLIAVFPAVGADSEPALIALVLAVIPVLVLQPCLDQLLRAHYLPTLSNIGMLVLPATNVAVNALLLVTGTLTVGTAVVSWVSGQLLSTLVLAVGVSRRLGGFGRFDLQLASACSDSGSRRTPPGFSSLATTGWTPGSWEGSQGRRRSAITALPWRGWRCSSFSRRLCVLAQRPDLVRATPAAAERSAALAVRGTMLITLALAAAMVALAPFLCVTVFGEEFRDSIAMMRILVIGVFGIIALKLLGNALTAQRKPMLETAAAAAAFVVILALDIILIPEHGGFGAAIASAIGYSVGGVAVALIFTRALSGRLRDLVPHLRDVRWLRNRLRRRAKDSLEPPQDSLTG